MKAGLSRSKRQGIQRTERRLAESGKLAARWLSADDDLAAWTQDFLRLEASGWKGFEHTALASTASQALFFRELTKQGVAAGSVQLGRLDFNEQPIAMICNLLARDGGYSFKIAYDEKFAEHSPGLLLELALIRELHERGTQWMDSCASADHPMINHLWPERTLRQSLVTATGRRGGDLAVSLMPALRWLKNVRKRRPAPKPRDD
ncbi:MAG: GNAT family N-acetyltransferase [Pirellulales bacterium]